MCRSITLPTLPNEPPHTAHDMFFNFRWEAMDHHRHMASLPNRTNALTNWNAVLEGVERMLKKPCYFRGVLHYGSRNIFRRVVVNSIPVQELILRIPIIPGTCSDPLGGDERWWTDAKQYSFESEIATMMWVAKFTPIPVPRICAFESTVQNHANVPWVLMTAVGGHTIDNVVRHVGLPTNEQADKIMTSIAWLQCQLSRTKIPKLGCLALNRQDKIVVGPLPQSFNYEPASGTTVNYLKAWCTAAGTKYSFINVSGIPTAQRAPYEFPAKLRRIVDSLTLPFHSQRAGFPLLRRNFLTSNLLFDDLFNVVGLVDWEGAHSAPFDIFAARTCMYSTYKTEESRLVVDGRYKREVRQIETLLDNTNRLSCSLGSAMGDLGMCIWAHENGFPGIGYGSVLQRVLASMTKLPAINGMTVEGFAGFDQTPNSDSECD